LLEYTPAQPELPEVLEQPDHRVILDFQARHLVILERLD